MVRRERKGTNAAPALGERNASFGPGQGGVGWPCQGEGSDDDYRP